MNETKIIYEALGRLKEHTGIAGKFKPIPNADFDGQIQFQFNGKACLAFIEVKKHVRGHQLPDLIRLNKQHPPLMVVTEYLLPKFKEAFRKANIAYLETNGNIYFKHDNLLLWLDGQKNMPDIKEKTGRAFTRTGLKLIFHFLLNEQLLNLTYREMANQTGIGFGNINVIINDLKTQGYLLQVTKQQYKLINKKELLQRWMVAYEEKLKPTLRVGTFRFLKEEDLVHWKKVPLKNMKTWWGAEPAGDLLTNYLKPAELTMYTLENKPDLIKHYRMIPAEQGNIKAYQKFWKYDEGNDNVVPALLVYVDLMNTGDRRCVETAQKIYGKLLQDKF